MILRFQSASYHFDNSIGMLSFIALVGKNDIPSTAFEKLSIKLSL